MTLRIKSENGTLNCEFTERHQGYNFKKREFDKTFQSITLSPDAENYLRRTIKQTAVEVELSGKECECFEVKDVICQYVNDEWGQGYTAKFLYLKSVPVADVVAGDGMKSAKEFLESVTGIEMKSDKVHLYNIEAKDLINWLDEYASQYKNQPTDDELWDETINTLKSKFKITRR